MPRRRRLRKIKDIIQAENDKKCTDAKMGDDGFIVDSIPIEPDSPKSEESADEEEKAEIGQWIAPDDPNGEMWLLLLKEVLGGRRQLSDFSNIPPLVLQSIEQDHAKSRKRRGSR